jgi:hypothetical protein
MASSPLARQVAQSAELDISEVDPRVAQFFVDVSVRAAVGVFRAATTKRRSKLGFGRTLRSPARCLEFCNSSSKGAARGSWTCGRTLGGSFG